MLLLHRLQHRPVRDDDSGGRSRRRLQRYGAGDWAANDRIVGGLLRGYRKNDSLDSPSDRP